MDFIFNYALLKRPLTIGEGIAHSRTDILTKSLCPAYHGVFLGFNGILKSCLKVVSVGTGALKLGHVLLECNVVQYDGSEYDINDNTTYVMLSILICELVKVLKTNKKDNIIKLRCNPYFLTKPNILFVQ
jgi:hypothetical protein